MHLSVAITILFAGFTATKAAVLPDIQDLIETAYPTWCIDGDEKRIDCTGGKVDGRFTPLYFTKEHSGGDPALGGYPTNIDIQYAFEYAAPYLGQACAGSPHHCSESFDGTTESCKACPKISTDNDTGPYGPGHVPPHISHAALAKAYTEGKGGNVADWFDYKLNACRVLPHELLKLIRLYYPRDEVTKKVAYPPPFSVTGGNYPLEFVNVFGESCEKETAKHGELICFENHSPDVAYPSYLEVGHGSPHYCTKEGKAADVNNDWCPYIFFGPNRGKYRHPHIAFSAVETYIAHEIMPGKCGVTWDDTNYPSKVDTTVAFPKMADVEEKVNVDKNSPQQPAVDDEKWTWPGPKGTKKKPVLGNFAISFYIDPEKVVEKPDDTQVSGTAMIGLALFRVITAIAIMETLA